MENRGLLFIPDISGFTRFVNQTEIEHSRLIIQELLETLINANQIGLEVSEIEGDAILFYKFGPIPTLDELYRQVENMFCSFHRNLLSYDHRRYCQCKACMSAVDFSLKIITHYGEFTGYSVRNFHKLIGKDIIVAHQLLKNDIELHEYWLVTNNLFPGEAQESLLKEMNWSRSAKQTESGEIAFQYTLLTALKNGIPVDPLPDPGLSKKGKVFSISRDYETDIITLFHATGDFNYRSQWLEGVQKVEEVNHFLPRVGMRCRCILEDGQIITIATSYTYTDDRIEFCELEEGTGNATYFKLEKLEPKKSRLTIDYYIENNLFKQIAFSFTKKKRLEEMFRKSIARIEDVVREIHLPANM
jgi:Protein of unknown function (DUF2652)